MHNGGASVLWIRQLVQLKILRTGQEQKGKVLKTRSGEGFGVHCSYLYVAHKRSPLWRRSNGHCKVSFHKIGAWRCCRAEPTDNIAPRESRLWRETMARRVYTCAMVGVTPGICSSEKVHGSTVHVLNGCPNREPFLTVLHTCLHTFQTRPQSMIMLRQTVTAGVAVSTHATLRWSDERVEPDSLWHELKASPGLA